MEELFTLLILDTPSAWAAILLTLFIIIVIPRLFCINWLNGLILSQITLFFTSLTTIGGLSSGRLSAQLGLHFFSIELLFCLATYALYSRLLFHRAKVLAALNHFFNNNGAFCVIAVSIIVAFFNWLQAPTDGSSRIFYMTAAWFSMIKPLMGFVNSLSFLGVFILLLNRRRRWLGYLLMLVVILGSIMTGSKASFALNLFCSYLVLRDLYGDCRMQFKQIDKILILSFISLSSIAALARLQVNFADLSGRFLLFGEANMLTYFSDYPTSSCDNVSIFSKIHRGWARLFGDASAIDIDTLFGFALMIKYFGVNPFTGPNARISAYALCNFQGFGILLFALLLLIYGLLMFAVFRRFNYWPTGLVFFYPFCISSLNSASQDIYIIMQDITYLCILFCVGFFLKSRSVTLHG
jgi:hypothetical protein